MPRKRIIRHSNKKETQIKTRLIELSMKVENFVYHKAPISEAEAEKFIREVDLYKIECNKDERSLQVIEKLTRCMKAIIAEHQEQRLNSCETNINNIDADGLRSNSASPVYSLPDEDRTQFTQEVENPVTDALNDVTKNITLVEDNDNYLNTQVSEAVNIDADVIDLCDDEQNDSAIEGNKNIEEVSDVNIDVDMNKALSCLSISDVVNDVMCTDVDCSQSILNQYEEINNLQQNYIAECSVTPKNNVDAKLQNDKPKNLNKSIKITKPIIVNSKNYNVALQKAINNNININKPIYNNGTVPNKDNLPEENVNITTNATNYIYLNYTATNSASLINTNIITKTYDTNNTPGPAKIINVIKKGKAGNNIVNKKDADNVNKKRGPRRKKETMTKLNNKITNIDLTVKDLNNTNTQNFKKAPRKTSKKNILENIAPHKELSIPIYNKNVQNDLSWLEEIRYVREIREDENDRSLHDLSENFWTNYYLPPNFDENDFN